MASEHANSYRYFNNHLFHDEKSGFTLDFSGFPELGAVEKLQSSYSHAAKACIDYITRMESGEIINKTAVESESENRKVDHYNLRMADSPVEGKSLQVSIDYWKKIKAEIMPIVDGSLKTEFNTRFTDVIFNGIGGSFLGPLLIIIAKHGQEYNFRCPGVTLNIHWTSNTDSTSLHSILSKVDLKSTLMVNMSKSGGTAETKGNMETFIAELEKEKKKLGNGPLNPAWHNIAITTPGSNFDKFATAKGFMNTFYMHEETGGRTSVGSAIGMVPAAFAGLDFEAFLKGQSHMDALTRRPNIFENPALIMAVGLDRHLAIHGPRNMIVLCYADFLKEFAHYLQQLYMESLGKEYNVDGVPQPEGLTCFGGVGTGEQHAFMQQVQKGISDCLVRFVYFRKRSVDYDNEKAGSMGRQLLAFVKGTEAALTKNGRPYMTSVFEENNEFNIGMMIALEERIVSMMAVIWGINAYDQPGVQDGKKAADAVNGLSAAVVKALEAGGKFTGTATQFCDKYLPEEKFMAIVAVDSILSDIEANIAVPEAYPSLAGNITIQRQYIDGVFCYSIAPLNP